MKKRNIIVFSISILLLIGFITLLIYGSKESAFTENGITYALEVDGIKQNNFPSKGMYRVDTECTNAKCKWDYDMWKLYIEEITGDILCNISFTTIDKKNFNEYIINLSGTIQGIGELVHETFYDSNNNMIDTGYRYEGKSPNNYVWFNNELWRIIGVMNNKSHGHENLNLIKIIKASSIGVLAKSQNEIDNWETSTLNNLLNSEYYNRQNANNHVGCFSYAGKRPTCNYDFIGILPKYRPMIKETTWYLGGLNKNYALDIYVSEKSENVKNGFPTKTNSKIGLMYASDFAFSFLVKDCSRTSDLYSCKNSWLSGFGEEWIITPDPTRDVFSIHLTPSGTFESVGLFVHSGANVRPTLYLNENVYVLDGDGSITDPYIIGMD